MMDFNPSLIAQPPQASSPETSAKKSRGTRPRRGGDQRCYGVTVITLAKHHDVSLTIHTKLVTKIPSLHNESVPRRAGLIRSYIVDCL